MSVKIKDGVSLRGVKPEAVVGLIVIHTTLESLFPGRDVVITSCTDGTHGDDSLHREGEAWDIRTKHMQRDEKHAFVNILRANLGAEWDVVFENEGRPSEHVHVEWDVD